VINR
jgi:hypothetical protein